MGTGKRGKVKGVQWRVVVRKEKELDLLNDRYELQSWYQRNRIVGMAKQGGGGRGMWDKVKVVQQSEGDGMEGGGWHEKEFKNLC